MSSVDPVAQERAIHLACSDAGINASELAVVELHGTGTALGDPVEVSALARTEGCRHQFLNVYLFSVFNRWIYIYITI